MANPGYGKRSAPGQLPRSAVDFVHLPPREAAIATYVDRLPDGADISVKSLAKVLPYGQCALRTALNSLQRAGHLRRGREHITDGAGGVARWVTRTWFSRTPRDDDWWSTFAAGDVPASEKHLPTDDEPCAEAPAAAPVRVSATAPALAPAPVPVAAPVHVPAATAPAAPRSRAYAFLAAIGRSAPSLTLSAAECAALAPQVTVWFDRGATEEDLLRALTNGLPFPVHSPAGLLRSRLASKLPPEPPPAASPEGRRPLRILECAICGVPGRPEALPGGHCAACRGGPARTPAPTPLPRSAVHAHATAVRTRVRTAPGPTAPAGKP